MFTKLLETIRDNKLTVYNQKVAQHTVLKSKNQQTLFLIAAIIIIVLLIMSSVQN